MRSATSQINEYDDDDDDALYRGHLVNACILHDAVIRWTMNAINVAC